jgi:hypothetical protein
VKYVLLGLLGAIVGAAAACAALVFNPFDDRPHTAGLIAGFGADASGELRLMSGAVLASSHEGRIPAPGLVPSALAEPAIGSVLADLIELSDAAGAPAGYAARIAVLAERSTLLRGELLVDVHWSVWLPGNGSLFIAEERNLWPLARRVVLPMHYRREDFAGPWTFVATTGPTRSGYGEVIGASGGLAGERGTVMTLPTLERWPRDGLPEHHSELRIAFRRR